MCDSSVKQKSFNVGINATSTSSTLLTACFNKNIEHIKYLIKHCHVNTEKLVSLGQFEDFDNITFFTEFCNGDQTKYQSIYNLTAPVLWHACRTFEFKVVKLLVELGARVNSSAETRLNSTPLM